MPFYDGRPTTYGYVTALEMKLVLANRLEMAIGQFQMSLLSFPRSVKLMKGSSHTNG
jgi:hypothetical protein